MPNHYQKILIVGGVAGGATAAARLRRLSEPAEIILFEKGEAISFANCGLPYYIGGEIIEKSALLLQTPKAFQTRYNVDVRVQNEVIAIDRSAQTVTVQNHLTGKTYQENYDKLILATGAEPIRPNETDSGSSRVFTLRNIADAYRIKEFIDMKKPQRAAVAGGGYIGLEMAENLKRAGLDVVMIQRETHVLNSLDFDTACDVHRHIERQGVRLLLESEVQTFFEKDERLCVAIKSIAVKSNEKRNENDKNNEIVCDMMIWAAGVQPESSLARSAGLDVNRQGAVIVSEAMQTSDPNIYAVGDVVHVTDFITGCPNYVPLAGAANKQGRIAADQICGIDSRYAKTQCSAIVRVFGMTVAVTGLNETAAKRADFDYEKVFLWQPNHAGYFPGAANMSIKIIFGRKDGRLLGTQITGFDGADKRCDVIATAIRAGMTAFDLTQLELCYAPPYSTAKDSVNIAGFVIENILTGKVKIFHWHDVAELQKMPDVQLLDVRTPKEYQNGRIDGFINIPLDELRRRIGELDPSRKIYVTCQTGVRSYAATRILGQHGFDAYNLSGGYRLWSSIMEKQIR